MLAGGWEVTAAAMAITWDIPATIPDIRSITPATTGTAIMDTTEAADITAMVTISEGSTVKATLMVAIVLSLVTIITASAVTTATTTSPRSPIFFFPFLDLSVLTDGFFL